jgi:hypothetical protein
MSRIQSLKDRRGWIGAAFVLCWLSPALAGASDFAFITTTDYITGNASVLWLTNPITVDCNVRPLHSDAVARYFDGYIYVVNRYGADNIQVLDPQDGFSTVCQLSVGAGSDPHDIMVLGPHKAYVTRYNTNVIWIIDPSMCVQTGSIDLSALVDADGKAEIDMMCRVGDRVFVTVQRLDRNSPGWPPVGPSYVAVIDVATNALVDTDPVAPGVQPIALQGTNPFSDIELDPYGGDLYISGVGKWGLRDGGVESIDPIGLHSNGIVFTENAAGGDILDVEIDRGTAGFAIVSDADFFTLLISYNAQTGVKTGTLYDPNDYVLRDIEISPSHELFLADRTPTNPGIRIFNVSTGAQLTTSPIDVCLPPYDITFSVPVQTGIGDPPVAGTAASLGDAFPNPLNPETTIPFTLASGTRVALKIYDAAGRSVRTLIDAERPAGPQSAAWDGKNDAGIPVASGVYFVRLDARGAPPAKKIVVVR